MKLFSVILGLASAASAHTLFTTLYINNKNQGDGTCVRMPMNGSTGTAPIYPIDGDAMACGYGGRDPVAFVCPAPSGAKLTFEWREWPDAQQPGAIDPGHKGPCSVYVKRVDDMFSDPAAGPGWFKIWEDGYDNSTQEWCTDRLIKNNGLMSVDLPTGLAPGYYLVRPEILALHFAYRGDLQFYIGCAQIFVQGGPSAPAASTVPQEYNVSIPGYVNKDTPGLGFDINKEPPLPAYPMPGPHVYVPTFAAAAAANSPPSALRKLALGKGAVPSSCLIKNANWCAKPVARYSDQSSCWAGVKDCYEQSKACWASAPASGSPNCQTWSDYCSSMNDSCEREEFEGPPAFEGKEKFETTPENIPEPWGKHFAGTNVGEDGADDTIGGGPTTTTTTTMTWETVPASQGKTSSSVGSAVGASSESACTLEVAETCTKSAARSVTTSGPGPMQTSTHGKCGPEFGQTCSGSVFGECCSGSGECGNKARHCSCGCEPGYGKCW